MTTFALIHGAGDVGWYWHLVEDELRRHGHVTVAPDLPVEEDAAGLQRYADVIAAAVEAITVPGERRDIVVVGQSFGGYVAPLVAERVGARGILLVAGMVALPGETAEEMFRATDWAPTPVDDTSTAAVFYHDVRPALAEEALRRGRRQSDTPGAEPWPLEAWPSIETRAVIGTRDRFFPPAWQRTVLRDRLGITPFELDSGHCPALSRPAELAAVLLET